MSENPHSKWVRILIRQEWESSFYMSENPHSIWVRILILYEWESSFNMSENPRSLWMRILIFHEWEAPFFINEKPHSISIWVRILILNEWVSSFYISENPHSLWVRILILYEWESSFFMSENPHSIWERMARNLYYFFFLSIPFKFFLIVLYISLLPPLFHLTTINHLLQFSYPITRSPLYPLPQSSVSPHNQSLYIVPSVPNILFFSVSSIQS
jgi:hypothetical protein